jgi:hypothetical protein
MAATVAGILLVGDHASRPAAATVVAGTLYSCTDHDLIYQSDGAAWSTWADLGGSVPAFATPSIALGATAAAGAAGTVIRSDATIDAFDTTDPAATAYGNAAVVGTVDFAARRDHVHPRLTDTTDLAFVIDGGGSAITTGVKGDIAVDFGATITQVTMLADQSGSIVVDIWKDTYANYPPTDADSITASAVPTISSTTKSKDSTLTGWTTTISAGDTLRFNVDSVTSITRVIVVLRVTRTS